MVARLRNNGNVHADEVKVNFSICEPPGAGDNGNFKGNYATLHGKIKAALPPTQSPNLFTLGPVTKFAAEQPFTP